MPTATTWEPPEAAGAQAPATAWAPPEAVESPEWVPPEAAPTSSAVGNTLKTAYKGVVKGVDTAIGGAFSLPDRLHAMGQKAAAHLAGAVGVIKPETVALVDQLTDEHGMRLTPGGVTMDGNFDAQTPLRKLALTGQQLSTDRQALIDENIPTDPARAAEWKTRLADMGGRVVPIVAMAPAGLPAVATVATGQMSEAERSGALAEGETPGMAEARAQAVLPAALATSVVTGGGPIQPGRVGAQLVKRAATGGVVNAAGGAAVDLAMSRPITRDNVMENLAFGAILATGMSAPETVAAYRATGKAAPGAPPGELPGALRAKLEPAEAVPESAAQGLPPSPTAKPLGLPASAKVSPEIAPEVQARIGGYYEPQSNAASIAEATSRIDAAGTLDAAKTNYLLDRSPDAAGHAMGLELVRKFQIEQRWQDAADILNDMGVKAKQQGQAIQVLSTLAKGTPEGMAAFVQRNKGTKLTPDELQAINSEMGRIARTTSAEVRLSRTFRLLDQLMKKSGKWDGRAVAVMNLSMLLNPKTIIRNLGGNQLLAGANLAADAIGAGVDAGVSVFTGKRVVSGPQIGEFLRGLGAPLNDVAQGYKQARGEGEGVRASIKEGLEVAYDMGRLVSADKVELGDLMKMQRHVFSSPLMRSFEKGLGLALGPADRAFYMARYRSSLRSQIKAAGAQVPTADMMDNAALEAARAIYQDRNFLSEGLNDMRRAANKISTFGYSDRLGVGQAVVPFVQVPAAMIIRGAEFTPLGFLRNIAEVVPALRGDRPFNQHEFTQSFSKALAGTAGLLATGYALHRLGVITAEPSDDPKVRALEARQGTGAYRINVSALKRAFQSGNWHTPQKNEPGDVLVSYDWAQPVAFPLAAGASYSQARQRASQDVARGKVVAGADSGMAAVLSGARSLEDQPMLRGVSGFMNNAASASQRGGILEAAAASMAQLPGQFMPSVVRQMRDLMDNRVMETRGSNKMEDAYQQLQANIPALADNLGVRAKSGPLGGEAERYQDGGNSWFNVFLNPAIVTRFKADPELEELDRLWDNTRNSAPIPGRPDRIITVNGKQKVLTAPETADYTQLVGRLARDAYQQMMASPAYEAASDEYRARKLADALGEINAAAKMVLFGEKVDPRRPDTMVLLRATQARRNPETREVIDRKR